MRLTVRQHALLILIAIGSAALYLPTIDGAYLSDDLRFFIAPLDWSDAGKVFLTEMGFIRPVWRLTMAMDHFLWGPNTLGQHAFNLLLHALCVILVGHLAWLLTRRFAVTWIAALFFGVHAAHAEPVVWLTGRVDPLCTVFVLGAWTQFLVWRETGARVRYTSAIAFFVLGLGSKEPAACVPLLLFAGEALRGRAGRFLATVPFFVLLGSYIAIRFLVFGGVGGYQTDEGRSTLTLYSVHQLAEGVVLGPLRGLFAPVNLEYWSTTSAQAFQWAFIGLFAALAVAVMVALAVARTRPGSRPDLLALALIYIPIAPAAMLLARGMSPSLMHSRILYLSTAGASILIASLLVASLRGRWRGAFVAAFALLHCALLIGHQQPWREASDIARAVPEQIKELYPTFPSPNPVVIFDRVPDSVAGAYIYRNGLDQALQLIHPQRPLLRSNWHSTTPFLPRMPVFQDRRFHMRWDPDTKTVSDHTEEVRRLPAGWADDALSYLWTAPELDGLKGSGATRELTEDVLLLTPTGEADVVFMTPRMPLFPYSVRIEVAIDPPVGDPQKGAVPIMEVRCSREEEPFTEPGDRLPIPADGRFHAVERSIKDLERSGSHAWKSVQVRFRTDGAKIRVRQVRVMGMDYLRERLSTHEVRIVDAQGIIGHAERIANHQGLFGTVPRLPHGHPDTRGRSVSVTLEVPSGLVEALIASCHPHGGARVDVSADGESFQPLGILPAVDGPGFQPRVLSFPDPKQVRYVRITAPERGMTPLGQVGFLRAPPKEEIIARDTERKQRTRP